MAPAPLDHASLCGLASRWLRQPNSKGGPGCQVAFTETRIGFLTGESPDAVGFRVSDPDGGSTVIECKTSRADFLADAKKPHRAAGAGMGRWRYFLCPEGLIRAHELPAGWGLLYAGARGKVSAVAGPASRLGRPYFEEPSYRQMLEAWAQPHDAAREVLLLANLLHRLGDPGAMNTRLRNADQAVRRLDSQNRRLSDTIKTMQMRAYVGALAGG